ncbi:MAG: agmatinase [Thaumarchaeota archaeon]|nr:agmatinase [Nitrososphaerota archaeon]|tara:strand:- start:673 stop:1539 length:867 start_codon:yes stop_codon:yes gene_type:complete
MSYIDLYLTKPITIQHGINKESDVYMFGVPFDSTCSYKPGTRFGPNSLRDAFVNIEINSTRYKTELEDLTIEDLGNVKFTVNPSFMLDMVGKVTKDIIAKNKQTIILGGEHLITFGTFMSMPNDTPLIIFDAHYDLRDEFTDTKFSHATFLRRIIEKRGSETIVHVGARGFSAEEMDFRDKMNLKSISGKQLMSDNGIKLFKDAISSFDNMYVSIDLDVVDPAFAPGVGTPEALGITSQQLMDLVYVMEDKKIKCLDIVELSPPYDTGATSVLAAKLMAEIIIMNSRN